MRNELRLSLSQPPCFFLGQYRSTFFQYFKRRRSVGYVVPITTGDNGLQRFIVFFGLTEFFKNYFFKFLQLLNLNIWFFLP